MDDSSINKTPFQVFGAIFSATASTFCLLHMRIVWVLATRESYRKEDCYRLMIQISIAQILMCPGYILLGLSRFFDFDPWPTALNGLISAARVEIFLSFVLAVNRLKIMANFRYSDRLHMILAALGWFIGIAHFSVLLTPCCSFLVLRYHYKISLDDTRPETSVLTNYSSSYVLAMNGLILAVYVVLVGYTLRLRLTYVLHRPSLISLWKENSILIYAAIRFFCDSSLTVFYFFGAPFLPQSLWVEIVLISSHQVDKLLLMPLLCLVVSKSIRNDVFSFLKGGQTNSNIQSNDTRQNQIKPGNGS